MFCDVAKKTTGLLFVILCALGRVAGAAVFSDDFNRAAGPPGSDWSPVSLSWAINGSGELVENSGATFQQGVLRWTAGSTTSSAHFGKIRLSLLSPNPLGLILRGNVSGGLLGANYAAHYRPDLGVARLERNFGPTWQQNIGSCGPIVGIANGDYMLVTLTGTGSGTTATFYFSPTDPDSGGPVSLANWIGMGFAECTIAITGTPTFVDSGDTVGIRTYGGSSTAPEIGDEWTAGDLADISAPGLICGDGTLGGSEECDDGNTVGGDGCSPVCMFEECGNGVLDPGEMCDDGNTVDGDGCSAVCTLEECGNNILDPGEECDDGNTVGGDGCSAICTTELCGNGFLDVGEECDDGNTVGGDGCSDTCELECGNGVLDPGEECEDGNTVGGDGCSAMCTAEVCGNGILDVGEECDDGNTVDGDGCSSVCQNEAACFSDDFDRAAGPPGGDWFTESLSWAINGSGELTENSGARLQQGVLRWAAGSTVSDAHFGKIQLSLLVPNPLGLILRGNVSGGSLGANYAAHFRPDLGVARLERNFGPTWQQNIGSCAPSAGVANGDYMLVTLTGTGSGTTATFYFSPTDPDGGGPVSLANWIGMGFAECAIAIVGTPTFVDSGDTVGIRTYAGTSTAPEIGDDWAAGDLACIAGPGLVCGDGTVGGSEECDDGNTADEDGCSSICQIEECGDSVTQGGLGEECDDGNTTSEDGCSSTCQIEDCGDGVTQGGLGEECDDSNTTSEDGCSSTCQIEECGDGVTQGGLGEECDDGNLTNGDGCSDACLIELCGNGVVDPGEECDDGNFIDGDGCSSVCTNELMFCGDGITDPDEDCDDVGESAACDADCTFAICGDGTTNGTAGETCDDGNTVGGDGCSATCELEGCGNGTVDIGEECDDGNTVGGDGCSASCAVEMCGNGTVDVGEECDDGNTSSGDGCSGACLTEFVTFSDDFNRASGNPGPNWMIDSLSWVINAAGEIRNFGPALQQGIMRWAGGRLETNEHWGKIQILLPRPVGLVLRANFDGPLGPNYVVHFRPNEFRFERNSGSSWVATEASCPVAPGTVANRDYMLAHISGSGPDTQLTIYHASSDRGEDIANWIGFEVCTVTPSGFIDAGDAVGIRAYSQSDSFGDNWSGGDLAAIGGLPGCTGDLDCDDGLFCNGAETCDLGSSTCLAGTDPCSGLLGAPEQFATGLSGPLGVVVHSGGNAYVSSFFGNEVIRIEPDGTQTPVTITGLTGPLGIAVDAAENVYVTGFLSHNAFQIPAGMFDTPPTGSATEIIDSTGDGSAPLTQPQGITVDDTTGDVFVAGELSGNVFRIEPGGGPVTEILSGLDRPVGVEVDDASNVFVSESGTSPNPGQVIRIAAPGYLTNTTILDGSGAGLGQELDGPRALDVDASGNVYVAGNRSNNAFRVDLMPDGTVAGVTEIIDSTGDGSASLTATNGIAVSATGKVYVAGFGSFGDLDNAFEISATGIAEIVNTSDGLRDPESFSVDVDSAGRVFVAGGGSNNLLRLSPDVSLTCDEGTMMCLNSSVELILDATGDGSTGPMEDPGGIATDAVGNVFITACGTGDENEGVWKIPLGGTPIKILSGDEIPDVIDCPVGIELDAAGNLYIAGFMSDNIVKIIPDSSPPVDEYLSGQRVEILDSAGLGINARFDCPLGIDVTPTGTVYAPGFGCSVNPTVIEIVPNPSPNGQDPHLPAGGATRTEIIDEGDGLMNPFDVAFDGGGNVFVADFGGDSVYRVAPDVSRTVSVAIGPNGDGDDSLVMPHTVEVSDADEVLVGGNGIGADNVLRRSTGGIVTEIIGIADGLEGPTGLAVGSDGNVFVAGFDSNNVLEVTPGGIVTELLSNSGMTPCVQPSDFSVGIDANGDVIAACTNSNTVYRIFVP